MSVRRGRGSRASAHRLADQRPSARRAAALERGAARHLDRDARLRRQTTFLQPCRKAGVSVRVNAQKSAWMTYEPVRHERSRACLVRRHQRTDQNASTKGPQYREARGLA